MILEKVYDELMAQIEDLKKAIAGGSGGSKDYDKLDNRPKVNNITLSGNKKSSDLKIAYSMTESEYAAATKNAESIYCLQENATTFKEEDETASTYIHWSATSSGYAASWVYAPSNQNFTGCTAVECDDPAITIDQFQVVEGDVQVFLSCEDTTQIGETVTFTFTLSQPAGNTYIVKDGIRFGGDNYSLSETVIGSWIDGSTLYRRVFDCGALPNNTAKKISIGTDIQPKKVYGIAIDNTDSKTTRPLPFAAAGDTDIRLDTETGDIRLITKDTWSTYNAYVIIEYTKATT